MKKVMLVLLFISSAAHAEILPQVGVGAGLSAGDKIGSVVEVYGGLEDGGWDLTYGYIRNDMDSMTLHTPRIELERRFNAGFANLSLGAGVGYTIPNSDTPGTLKNGFSGLFGAGLTHSITPNLSVGLKTRFFVFNTKSQTNGELVESENLNGQTVETVTPVYYYNSLNFNSVMTTLSLNWLF